MPAIMPTGCCFDDALETLAEMVESSPGQTDDLFLVHGLYRPYGTLWAHAWVEWESPSGCRAIFVGLLDGERQHFMAARAEYYAETHVEETTRYPVAAVRLMMRQAGHAGPWVSAYLAYCLPWQARRPRGPALAVRIEACDVCHTENP